MKRLLIFLVFITSFSHAQSEMILLDVSTHTIYSEQLSEERNYWVSLPADYDSLLTYPVMYVLDAESRFNIVNTIGGELAENGKIPPHIVVGITHPNRKLDMSFSRTRVNHKGQKDTTYFNKDNSGNGLKFFKFIEEELIKEVKQNYRTSGFNILIGHSIGGYFCSYILPNQSAFNALQIYDPCIWYSDGEAIKQIEDHLSKDTQCNIFLASSGNLKHEFNNHHKKINTLRKTLKRYPNIHMDYKNYKNENHNSMYMHGFIDGMAFLYDGYEIKLGDLQSKISVSSIEKHFVQFSEHIHFDFPPPLVLYLSAGRVNYYQKNYQASADALEIYLKKKPTNSYAHELIGDAYFMLGKKERSLLHYKKSLEISPYRVGLKEKINNFK